MFKKILIANRGEIACRVAATARRLGVRTVAVYSDADRGARHVAECDEAWRIGEAAPRDSYLHVERILAAARASGAQAVHPGYGFLSENAEFAQACADAGLVFIGPPASAIQAMGLKSESKRLMAQAGVPLVPGYHGADQDAALLQREADAIGYPVLIKASAGGGGKGMRVVSSPGEFAAALASCQREARNSFGNDAVLIERYLTRPRHIEIQVFADTHGRCIHLFERDCSVQRRHQKVLEEAPAPGLDEPLRREMGAAAVAAARAVGYVGAGTVEFIAEPAAGAQALRFYFMEMNTRLQVEHPVTEAITGLDLVEWQLRVASGEPLPLGQDDLRIQGHAIEARICAEQPDRQFMPATGALHVFRMPQAAQFSWGDGQPIRVDAGVREGDAITPYYDPMIAKLIVRGADRTQALARLESALSQARIAGLHTNVDFLRRLAASRAFAGADLDTALIERERGVLFESAAVPPEVAIAGVVAEVLAGEQASQGAGPWSRRDGWRLQGAGRRWFDLVFQGTKHRAVLEYARGAAPWVLRIGPDEWVFGARARGAGWHEVTLDGRMLVLAAHAHGAGWTVFAPEGSVAVARADAWASGGDGSGDAGRLTAPMPGKLVAYLVRSGQSVVSGQPLAVIEAMKMEHTVASPREGTVQALLHAPGDTVLEGAELLRLAPP